MNFQDNSQKDVHENDFDFENSSEVVDSNFDKMNAATFDSEKLDNAIALFCEKYPNAQDHEIIDFIGRARRSFIKAKRRNISDKEWVEKLKKYIDNFKLVLPLKQELEKLILNQKLVQMQIEQTQIIKEKAELEKEKINFLLEQNNLLKNGKSSIYPNLTTIDKLETIKKNIEDHYKNQLSKIYSEHSNTLKNTINSEVARVHQEFENRYKQWSKFYEMFKEKYANLQNFSLKIREELNDKNNETYDLKLKVNQLINGIKSQKEQINFLKNEILKRNEAIHNLKNNQPNIIKQSVEQELEVIIKDQNNKLHSILSEKEKKLVSEFEQRRNEIEKILSDKEEEFNKMNTNVKEMYELWSTGQIKLEELENKYDGLLDENKSLTINIDTLKTQNADLVEMLKKLRSENIDLDKLNNLLVKKYHDSKFFETTSKKLSNDITKLFQNQKELLNLVNDNKFLDGKKTVLINELTEKVNDIDNKLDSIRSFEEVESAKVENNYDALNSKIDSIINSNQNTNDGSFTKNPNSDFKTNALEFDKPTSEKFHDEFLSDQTKSLTNIDDDNDDSNNKDVVLSVDKLLNIE